MKRFLRSTWFITILALVLGIGTQAFVLGMKLTGLEEVAAVQVDVFADPDTISWSFLTPDLDQMRVELHARLEEATARETELAAFELRLKSERGEMERLRRDLEKMRKEIGSTITEVQLSEQKNLKTLAATYSNVEPGAALAIFREMEDEMVVKILAFMKPDPVGRILETMAQTKAGNGEGTMAPRAAVISNKLRLLRQVRADEDTSS
jgi:flagellar motility protein MotE (MotC chaperone)